MYWSPFIQEAQCQNQNGTTSYRRCSCVASLAQTGSCSPSINLALRSACSRAAQRAFFSNAISIAQLRRGTRNAALRQLKDRPGNPASFDVFGVCRFAIKTGSAMTPDVAVEQGKPPNARMPRSPRDRSHCNITIPRGSKYRCCVPGSSPHARLHQSHLRERKTLCGGVANVVWIGRPTTESPRLGSAA